MNVLFLFIIIIFLSGGDLTSENETLLSTGGDLTSENETLALNVSAINNIMTSKISVNINQMNESEAMNYFYGDSDVNENDQRVDISDFEPDEVKRLYYTAQTKSELMEREYNRSRRWWYTPTFIPGNHYILKALDFMRQSIYGTRYRLKDTKHIRKIFANDPAYQIAILYGSLMQLKIKMDNIYATLYKFDRNVKFLWHIVLYERCIAATVDANSIVEKIFALARKALQDFGFEQDYMVMEPPSSDKFQPKFPEY